MKLKDMKKEDLELMSYDDLAFLILSDAGAKMKINDLFKKVCEILSLSDEVFENKIADFFELLSTEKRFVMLEDGYWDLRDNHSQKIVIDDDDDIEEEIEEDEEEIETEDDEDIFDETDETDDIADDDLKDFAVIEDEDEENTELE